MKARPALPKPKKVSITKLKKKLWVLCRELIRAKYGNKCFTCGRSGLSGGNWQTGHFITSSICSTELRYDLDNLRPQCYHCNINLSGNWVAFEAALIVEKGVVWVAELKMRNELSKGMKFGADWLQRRIEFYEELSAKSVQSPSQE